MQNRSSVGIGKIIFFLMILAVVITGGLFVYYKFEKPIQDNGNLKNNLNIYAIHNGKQIVTGYKIFLDSTEFNLGQTMRQASIQKNIPLNRSGIVYSYNLDNQNYYFSSSNFSAINEDENTRIELNLISPGSIEVEKIINSQDKINITLNSDGIYKNANICLKWSTNIVYVTMLLPKSFLKPKNYENYNKCFFIGDIDGNIDLSIDYKSFINLNSKDFISIAIFDGDYINGIFLSEDHKTQEDYFGNNIIKDIHINNI